MNSSVVSKAIKPVLHFLPNAHLDPVWLWDWREGLNEGITTVRTILNLMDEFPRLTFIRGESMIYEHIEKTDRSLFNRLRKMVETGRWDIVGGTVIQPDSNLAGTETLCRQFEQGLAYFESRFGKRPTAAWQADSFGHTPGWPNILESFGLDSFAFTRPQQAEFPLPSPVFHWEGDHGNQLLCYRQHWKWYCSERFNLLEIIDSSLAQAVHFPFRHIGILMGLGNHGGGPSRRHLQEIELWQQRHPEVEVRFSTLHGFFRQVREESKGLPPGAIPVIRGDLGYCLRGCYSSVQRFKSLYRKGEAVVANAEITQAIIGGPSSSSLHEAWKAVLFNAFHDILPGSSIERAYDDQSAWMGLAIHRGHEVTLAALNDLAARIDTSVSPVDSDRATDVPVLIWNPLPRPFQGLVELEVSLDYRPLFEFKDRPGQVPVVAYDHKSNAIAFQLIGTEHSSMPDLAWRKRLVVPLTIPAWGWTVVRIGYRDKPRAFRRAVAKGDAARPDKAGIANGVWNVDVVRNKLRIKRNGTNFFSGERNLELLVVEDPWGSWGGMNEEKDSFCLETVRERWKLEKSEVLEEGPFRARLWTHWRGANSWIDLTFAVGERQNWIEVEGRLLWNERSARLKLVLPSVGRLECDVPGGVATRTAEGQLPVGRWVRRSARKRVLGFASDVLSDVDVTPEELRITLARATRYANDVKTSPTEKPWRPAVDCGELKFKFCLYGADASPDRIVEGLLHPPMALVVPPQKGSLAGHGSLGSIRPSTVRILSVESLASGQLRVRAQNRGSRPCQPVVTIGRESFSLGLLKPQQIKTVCLDKKVNRRNHVPFSLDHASVFCHGAVAAWTKSITDISKAYLNG